MVLELNEHPLREVLVHELHARPYQHVEAPESISHIALWSQDNNRDVHLAAIGTLCDRYDMPPPRSDAKHYAADFGAFRLKWEAHTEFATYTFFRKLDSLIPFEHKVIDLVPQEWLKSLPGQLVAAVHIAAERAESIQRSTEDLERLFAGNSIFGSRVSGGGATVYTDLRVHEDRFTRILVRNINLNSFQMGRLIQRLVEIATYRVMALLGFPVAQEMGHRLREADLQLASLAKVIAADESETSDHKLLDRLSAVAAEIEDISASSAYRFEATRAYSGLLTQRLEDLREEKIVGLQTFAEFLRRRMNPAMSTCESVYNRQKPLSERAARLASLLRARVDVELERQNRDLLDSMNKRAKLQLRLQEAVEGLSVVAISYYLTGLLGYGLKPLQKWGLIGDLGMAKAVVMVGVVLVVFFGLRTARKHLLRDSDDS